ncbi:MAG: toxin-antitoxin system HicB family antitoxin [Candidatus Omnitrophica bacterium]|nr:toxin-antitoxin system HicB family antitoxin [Candidatus Omnitrophota bacterium]
MDNNIEKYSLNIVWSEEDKSFVATSPVFNGLMAFGDTKEEALHEASVAIQAFLKTFQETGEQLPDPDVAETYSGQFRIRIPKSLHRRLAEVAAKEGVSLNQYVVAKLSGAEAEEKLRRITNIYSHNFSVNLVQNNAEEGFLSSSRQGDNRFVNGNK